MMASDSIKGINNAAPRSEHPHMCRKTWKAISAIAAVLFLTIAVLVYVFWGPLTRPRTMCGPLFVSQGESPKHGFLGVDFTGTAAPLTIRTVLAGSGADDAGLQSADVIRSAGGAEEPDLAALQHELETALPGCEMLINIQRGPEVKAVRVPLIRFSERIRLRDRLGPVGTGP